MTSPANYHEAGPDTQGDITDIDSIIEINSRGIATTVETQWFITEANARNDHRRPRRRRKGTSRERHQLKPRGYPGPAKRVNGRGSDLLSFGPRIVTNLRDRVTVRLTTTRRRNAASYEGDR